MAVVLYIPLSQKNRKGEVWPNIDPRSKSWNALSYSSHDRRCVCTALYYVTV